MKRKTLLRHSDLLPFVSHNIDEDRVSVFIELAQKFDVAPELGKNKDLYHEMLFVLLNYFNKPEGAKTTTQEDLYLSLYNGHPYGNPLVTFEGLRMALIYFSIARIVKGNDLRINEGGNSFNMQDYSERPSFNSIKLQAREFESIAIAYMQDVRDYLDKFHKLYPLWKVKNNHESPTKRTGSIRFSSINALERKVEVDCKTVVKESETPPTPDPERLPVRYGYNGTELGTSVLKSADELVIEWPKEADYSLLWVIIPVGFTPVSTWYYKSDEFGTLNDYVFSLDNNRIDSRNEFYFTGDNRKITFR